VTSPRVIGIDPGTVSIDFCGVQGDQVFLDRTIPTAEALDDPAAVVALLGSEGPVDLIAGPSGYGLPLTRGVDVTDADLRLAFLGLHDGGGIGGLTALARALTAARLPIVFTPGVVHLETVPAYRKINRVDLGTADKVCATALAVDEQCHRRGCPPDAVSLILVELGGAFTAAVAVAEGRIVDGVGGSSGPIGLRACGAWDGEVAALAGRVTKAMLFAGGVETVSAAADQQMAWDAYVEGTAKAVAALAVSVPSPAEIVLSGRLAWVDSVFAMIAARLARVAPVRRLTGFAATVKQAAQGAALIADGLAGGTRQALVDTLGIRTARGSVLDHLYVIPRDVAFATVVAA
jgi:predicted butyrate kinase (DUF1464 family)